MPLNILPFQPPQPLSLGKGYFGGGYGSNEIDGIDFSTEAAINPSAALVVARYG